MQAYISAGAFSVSVYTVLTQCWEDKRTESATTEGRDAHPDKLVLNDMRLRL